MLYVVPTTFQHVLRVGRNLRAADALEASARGHPPLTCAYLSWSASLLCGECLTVLCDGIPCGLFGHDGQSIWLIGTDLLTLNALEFLRASPEFIHRLLCQLGGTAFNWVDTRNTVHIRWLEWLGASFHEVEPLGINGEPFQRFTLCVNQLRSVS